MTSDRINLLRASEEVFYRRLMNKVDDHGLFDARPTVLRATLYPLRLDKVRAADCAAWLAACARAELVVVYDVDGKPYGQMLNTRWQTRAVPKYPLPSHERAVVYSCEQLQTLVNGCSPSRSRCSESESKTFFRSSGASGACTQVFTGPADALETGFSDFWQAYPRKVNKADARKAWRKLQPDRTRVSQILRALAEQRTWPQWTKDDGQFIPHPSSWLNGHRWEDEPPPTSDGKSPALRALEAKVLHGP